MILIISGVFLVIGILLCIFGGEDFLAVGCLVTVLSLMLGFGLFGLIIPVASETTIVKPNDIAKSGNAVFVKVGRTTLECDKHSVYLADVTNIVVEVTQTYNSYHLPLNETYTVFVKK